MSEAEDTEGQGEHSPLTEIEEATIIENLRLLTIKLVGIEKDEVIDKETESNLLDIKRGETYLKGDKRITGIKIEYDTASGRIQAPQKSYQFGERSRINTSLEIIGDEIEYDQDQDRWVTRSRGTRNLLLYQPGDMPLVEQYTQALANEEVSIPDDRRILPERIIPEHPELMGIRESWGHSQFTSNARGDLVILRTIQQFNAKFGPAR